MMNTGLVYVIRIMSILNEVWGSTSTKEFSVIRIKCMSRNKIDENGIIVRNKTRLVTQGYNQKEEIDFENQSIGCIVF